MHGLGEDKELSSKDYLQVSFIYVFENEEKLHCFYHLNFSEKKIQSD